MRHLLALTVASLAAVACGSTPTTEPAGSTTEAQLFCPVGTKLECTTPNKCTCVVVPPPPVCTFDVPTPPQGPPQNWWWIEAWATTQTAGQCPDVPGAGGTWKNVDPSKASDVVGCFMGVPCVSGDPTLPPPSCANMYPAGEPCCTYVWWPAGFVLEAVSLPLGGSCYASVESACDSNPNDEAALCRYTGQVFTAMENVSCTPIGREYPCGEPGGSGCTGACGRAE